MLTLRDYQERAVTFAYERDRVNILAAVGGGKTAIALTLIRELIRNGVAKRFLVLAPKRVAAAVWPVELEKWAPDLSISVAVGTLKRRQDAYLAGTDIVVTNYDNAQSISDKDIHTFDGVVFDELTKLKNPGGKRFKALEKKLEPVKLRYGLTGSFTSNGLEDVFGQCKIVDASILGTSKGAFMQQYFVCINREYGQWVPLKTSFPQVMDKIKPITFLLENEEYKDKLPPLHTVEVNIEMEDMAPYNAMKRDFVVEMDGHQVTAMSAASLTTKCQQMSSGFLYDSDTLNKIKTPVWFSSHKFDRLEEILEENQHAPTIIFYQFIEELAELKRRFPQLCTLDSPNAVQRFNEGKIEILAAHPKSAGHGLNLQGTAHHIVFLSLPWSLELYEQAIGRLHRGGQKHAVWVYLLMTKGTIDKRIFTALHNKRALAEICVDELRG